MRQRKGQTAMEYLMTYGWAIIIVIIVGVALWQLGVFSPSAGKVSTGFDTFSIGTDFKIETDGSATAIVMNADKQSRTVTMNNATIGGQDCTGDEGAKAAGATWTLTCTGLPVGAQGSPYRAIPVVMEYTVATGNYTETGHITGEYE